MKYTILYQFQEYEIQKAETSFFILKSKLKALNIPEVFLKFHEVHVQVLPVT